jgi:hypothetical protein
MHGREEKFLAGKLQGKRPLGSLRCRLESFRMGLAEIVWEGTELIHLAQDRDQWRTLVNTVTNLRFS